MKDGFGDTDTLISIATGTSKSDTLIGSNIRNWLVGGDGNDTVTGGGGQDNFAFEEAGLGAGNVDSITDFNVAADTIQLAQSIFSALAAGDLANNQFTKGATSPVATNANHRIIYNTATGEVFYDPDGNTAGGVDQQLFAILTASPNNVSAADFDIFT